MLIPDWFFALLHKPLFWFVKTHAITTRDIRQFTTLDWLKWAIASRL